MSSGFFLRANEGHYDMFLVRQFISMLLLKYICNLHYCEPFSRSETEALPRNHHEEAVASIPKKKGAGRGKKNNSKRGVGRGEK